MSDSVLVFQQWVSQSTLKHGSGTTVWSETSVVLWWIRGGKQVICFHIEELQLVFSLSTVENNQSTIWLTFFIERDVTSVISKSNINCINLSREFEIYWPRYPATLTKDYGLVLFPAPVSLMKTTWLSIHKIHLVDLQTSVWIRSQIRCWSVVGLRSVCWIRQSIRTERTQEK